MDDLPELHLDESVMDDRLAEAVARRLLEPGLSQRVRLAYRLEGTLPGGAVSGEALGRTLRLTRAAIHKHVDQLRALGFPIESAAGAGYCLSRSADDLVAAEAVVPYLLQDSNPAGRWFVGLPYIYLGSCRSTNLVLRQAASGRLARELPNRLIGDNLTGEALPAGAVAVTDHQVSGRGRLDRAWSDQVGKELMFSVLLRPSLAPGQAHLVSLAAALAIAQTLERLPGLMGRVRVKWPNDVLIDEGKVCGILVEGSMDTDRLHWAVVGIGVNVNSDPAELMEAILRRGDEGVETRPRPVSLRQCLGRQLPRAPLLAAFFARLTVVWKQLEDGPAGVARVLACLRERDALAGSVVEVRGGAGRHDLVAAGRAVGIGPEGQLLLRTAVGETVSVAAGDVTLRRQPLAE
ncbi:MAG: biotin--[acetyl-CoA-carboxylase] ligase [Actinobacteria bacterium]|nr:biotin--[acetyl-CoA-carboxylase] ligase [Actinomycetota bacterium]